MDNRNWLLRLTVNVIIRQAAPSPFKSVQEIKKSKIWKTISYQGISKRSGEYEGGVLTAVLPICIMQMICMSNRKTNWQWQNNGVAGERQALLEQRLELLSSISMRRQHLQLFCLAETLYVRNNWCYRTNMTERWRSVWRQNRLIDLPYSLDLAESEWRCVLPPMGCKPVQSVFLSPTWWWWTTNPSCNWVMVSTKQMDGSMYSYIRIVVFCFCFFFKKKTFEFVRENVWFQISKKK